MAPRHLGPLAPGLAALALLLALPAASAQQPLDPVLTVDPLPGPITPMREPVTTPFRLDVLCEPAVPGSPAPIVQFWLDEVPEWALAVPSYFVSPMDATCAGSRIAYEGEMTITLSEQAPATTPGAIVLAASYQSVRGNVTARATLNVTASYFGLLEVEVDDSMRIVSPGGAETFRLRLVNRGNAEGIVRLDVVNLTQGYQARVPDRVTLESAQEGGSRTGAEIEVAMRAPAAESISHEVGSVNLSILLERASDGAPGDASAAMFILTVRERAATPAPGAWGALALVAVALLTRRRRPS